MRSTAPPLKTQSGLLECMEERQATIDGVTHRLAEPFIVVATQNPVENAGVYPLPEAELDRFLFKTSMNYPTHEECVSILDRFDGADPLSELKPAVGREDIIASQQQLDRVYVHRDLKDYIASLCERTREYDNVLLGVSPRGAQSLLRASKGLRCNRRQSVCSARRHQARGGAGACPPPYAVKHRKNQARRCGEHHRRYSRPCPRTHRARARLLAGQMSPAEFFTRYGGIILAVLLISGFIFALVRLYLYLRAKMIARIVYSRSFSELGTYEGERITMTETIYNPTPLPLFAVNIEGYIYNGIKMAECTQDPKKPCSIFYSRFKLMPFQQVKRTHNAVCAARGYYRLETVDIYGGGKTTYIDAPAELYIYPRILPLPERVDPVNTLQGDHTTRRHLISDPFTFNGIRAYAAGDPMNSINYKATARSGGCDISSIRVNSREFCANRAYMVYLNFQLVGEEHCLRSVQFNDGARAVVRLGYHSRGGV